MDDQSLINASQVPTSADIHYAHIKGGHITCLSAF